MTIDREQLRGFLIDHFGLTEAELDDDTRLFSDGLLDSLSLHDLILFIEESSELKMKPEDITLDNLESISRMLAYVAARSG